MQNLEKRLTELERSMLPSPTRTAILMPDSSGNYPEPPPGVAKGVRVEFVEGGPRHESELRAGG